MADTPFSPESQKALEEVEKVWKAEVADARPAPVDGEVAPLLDMDVLRGDALRLLATFVDPARARDRSVTAAGMTFVGSYRKLMLYIWGAQPLSKNSRHRQMAIRIGHRPGSPPLTLHAAADAVALSLSMTITS